MQLKLKTKKKKTRTLLNVYDLQKFSPASNPSPANSPPSPTPAPSNHSPPAPSPGTNPSPSPAPAPADDAHDGVNHAGMGGVDEKSSSSGGMSSGKKAGIALGVIIGAGVVVLGALVYKRRRQNIQRSQYGYAARRELL